MRLLRLIVLGLLAVNLAGCGGMMVYQLDGDDDYVIARRVRPHVIIQRNAPPMVRTTKNPSIYRDHRCHHCERY